MEHPTGQPRERPQTDVPSLLASAAAGDEGAWREIVSRYARRVYALARSRRLDEEASEDVAQSVMITTIEHITTGRYTESGKFEAWLFRVAANRVRDEIRRRGRQAEPIDPASFERRADGASTFGGVHARAARPATPQIERADEHAPLREAMEELNDADREVVSLRHYAGLAFAEIAAALNEPLGTVLARHHRALSKLREALRIKGYSE